MTMRTITGKLILRTPLHIGISDGTEAVDDLLRRDARGRLLIPGPSLAGALRAIATRLGPRFVGQESCLALKDEDYGNKACECLVCQLFGNVNPQVTVGEAPSVIIYNALPTRNPETQIRDGVGIDRVSGAAARKERLKFDIEVVSAETAFDLRIELESKLSNANTALDLLAASLAEWEAGRGVAGGRVGRGMGAFALVEVRFNEQKLDTVESLVDFLKKGPDRQGNGGDSNWVSNQVSAARSHVRAWAGAEGIPIARSWAQAEFILAADGPFLINDPVRSGQGGFDHAPLLAAYEKGATAVLPGSSLRGVLRSQAERIARTIATLADPGDGSHFKKSCPACNSLTAKTDDDVASCNSFVKTLEMKERQKLERTGAEDRLCLACRLFGSPWNGSRLRVEDAYLFSGTGKRKVMDFLAIDRFTGGGRDGAKFDAVVLWKPKFQVRMFLENPKPWELGWLALALRDLHEGLATVGFGAAKGFGQVKITEPKLTLGFLHESDFAIPVKLRANQDQFSGLYQVVKYNPNRRAEWLGLANGWMQAFRAEVKDRPRSSYFALDNDSYFTKKSGFSLPALYPMEDSV